MRRRIFLAGALIAIATFMALGVWQIERRAWKLALIAQVERRVAAAPVPAPGAFGPDDAYTPVIARGRYTGGDTFVQAVTDLGAGWWALAPLATSRGNILINRGFVPTDARATLLPPPAGPVTVRGLLRVTEPGGGFLRHNAPAQNRWYSRDTAAIGAARGVRVAPYFIDAAAAAPGWPRGGLTVVRFRNTHLVYALTWFALTALVGVMSWRARK